MCYYRTMETVKLIVTNNEFRDMWGNAITYRRYSNQPDELEQAIWGSNRCFHTKGVDRDTMAAQTQQAIEQDNCDCQPNMLVIETRVWE